MAVWEDLIPPAQMGAYESKGLSGRRQWGSRPAVLVVDMVKSFVQDEESYVFCRTGKDAVAAVRKLLDVARPLQIPVIYTTNKSHRNAAERGRWKSGQNVQVKDDANDIADEILPQGDESVIEKLRPSAFWGTELISLLVYHQIDTLIVTGVVTSGCIRATVVDAFSHNYLVIIPEECVADRNQISHKVNLFDMHMKYADVVPLEETIRYLENLKA